MGKTAKNEKIKLIAAFLNNSGVALCAAGALLPILALYTRAPNIAKAILDQKWFDELFPLVGSLIAVIFAFAFGIWLHFRALKVLDRLED